MFILGIIETLQRVVPFIIVHPSRTTKKAQAKYSKSPTVVLCFILFPNETFEFKMAPSIFNGITICYNLHNIVQNTSLIDLRNSRGMNNYSSLN